MRYLLAVLRIIIPPYGILWYVREASRHYEELGLFVITEFGKDQLRFDRVRRLIRWRAVFWWVPSGIFHRRRSAMNKKLQALERAFKAESD